MVLMNKQNQNEDLKIEKIKKTSGIIGAVGIAIMLSVILFDLSYPYILFSVLLTLSIALIFISAGMYLATWIMEAHLAYKRKQYLLLALIILAGLIFIFWQIYYQQN